MAVELTSKNSPSDALRPGAVACPTAGRLPAAEWFVVCGLDGGLVADLKLSNPPVIRGPIKALRAGLATVLEVLNTKNFRLHDEAGRQENETKDKTATTMKTNLLTDTDGQGSDNGGGQGAAPEQQNGGAGEQQQAAAAEGAAQQEEAKGTPAEDNADATGKATA